MFKKSQIVYQVTTGLTSIPGGKNGGVYIPEVRVAGVIERQIESCGKKQMTFFDRCDMDSTFGRTQYHEHRKVFATADEAFAALRANPHVDVICPTVYSDASRQWCDDVKSGEMLIAEK